MGFPKLKNALLCRILPYITVLGGCILPLVILFSIEAIPMVIKAVVGFGLVFGLLFYMIKNFMVLMALDFYLASIHCHNTARKKFSIPDRISISKIEKKFLRYGMECAPTPAFPRPTALRYRFKSSMTVHSCGTELVVATYHTDFLDKEEYSAIFDSAIANSQSLIGKKKARFLDKSQKSAPLQRVTVIAIFANEVDCGFAEKLYREVCKEDGDGALVSVIPCIIDIKNRECVFNCLRLPYCGFGYPVKNRGVRLIRKYVFGGKLPLKGNDNLLDPMENIDLNKTLWQFWRDVKYMIIGQDEATKKLFESMEHGEVKFDGEFVFVRCEERGIQLAVLLDEDLKIASVDPILSWMYPKANAVSKKDIEIIKKAIINFFLEMGYSCEFISVED